LPSLAIRQDCCGKSPCLWAKILAYPAHSGHEPGFKRVKKGAETDFIDLFLRHCRTRIDCKYSIIPQAGSQEKTLWYGLNLIDSANT
jgi:hypothetical protein